MRWRIKFMIIGLGLLLGVRIYTATQALLYSMIDTTIQTLNAGAVILGGLLIARSLYRSMLIETDIYVSQSVLFRSVTVLMAGAYLLLVGLLARLLTYLGTIAGFPVKALLVFLVLAGLAVLLASDRVRQASRRFVGRHFHRPLYDYRQVWESFTRRTALLTDLPAFGQEVARVVSETFEALAVTIWQFDDTRGSLTFVGSTAIPTALAQGPAGPEAASLLNALQEMDKPVDMDADEHPELAALKACNPMVFPDKGGHRIAVPLASGTERLGIMVLGDRVNGLPYTSEELELLRTIGAQIAAHLLNLKLAQQVLEAKQIEAFQTMSAFFVHDLKNTASTLSLMLQNMPRHYADPQFREDALKGIAASADRINEIIRRLTLLRQQDLNIKPVLADFNDLVRQTVAPIQAHAAHAWVLELGTLPPVALDPAQVQKVVTNLILNARDATPPGGLIRVQTEIRDPWVVLTVADSGCGMSREFMARDLFRPFQSRKRDGMGIGLFHTKMIVAAHRGKIEVESLEGQGSTFRVLLPLTSSEVAP
jgi:putative PEP-CTERM system histidine kinase